MSAPVILEPLRFPLHGSALIEASAGTGKTFTIAALYLRLVLGHGGEHAFGGGKALVPPEILVVTFTEAATKELRDRIRHRLAEAARAFLEPERGDLDPLLAELRAGYLPQQWPECERRLRVAAEWMDEAAVSTIHGWCNRMLREHAFASGSLFTQSLEADLDELLHESVRDYWRTFFYPLPAADAGALCAWWTTPQALSAELKRLLEHRAHLEPGRVPADALHEAREAGAARLRELKAPWLEWIPQLRDLLDSACAKKLVDRFKLQSRHYRAWLEKLQAWAEGDAPAPDLDARSMAWTRLTPAGIREAWKVGEPPAHPAWEALAGLRDCLRSLPTGRADVLCHAAHWVGARLAAEQERRAQMGFNDLLTQLDAALQGRNGDRLAALVREQFPVALIDEFQDTDPLQYRIFDAIYDVAGHAPDRALVLIGDPKQAIYAFRGADIHTYLLARRATDGRHATLGTNFRSSTAMVEAVNRFFVQAEQRPEGRGAFLFRGDGNPLPFLPVQAQGRKERWSVDGKAPPALQCWWLDPGTSLSKEAYVAAMAQACAGEIVRLLRLGQAGQAGFAGPGDGWRPLRPSDIAVLVHTGREARAVRAALAQRGVRSVYLSDQDSVFETAAAGDVERLLQACAEPEHDGLLRAALATALLGLDWSALDRLNRDELHWEDRVLQFRGYRDQWRRQGVLPMLRRLLHDFGVPARLLATGDERTLTDVLHLAELLQEGSSRLEGEHALVRHLAELRQDRAGGSDARLVRLESDAELLKVVTVHKSKGLEYPLVFLPFACSSRPVTADDLPLKWHDEEGRLRLAVQADPVAALLADDERLGEDLRKLYVALTRARHATWIGIAPLKGLERTAVGYLLAGGEAVAPGGLAAALEQLKGECPHIAVLSAPPPRDEVFRAEQGALALGPEPPLPRGGREPWWIASYSALRVATAVEDAEPVEEAIGAPGTAIEATYRETLAEAGIVQPAATGGEGLHAFPRGPGPGSFLHGLLEWAGRHGFGAAAAAPADLAAAVARRCAARGWQQWAEPLAAWLQSWLSTPLDLKPLDPAAAPVAPAQLTLVQVEMEFWFGARQVDAQALDGLVREHTLGRAPRTPLMLQRLNGMLKGFIDLVFEHAGRYYVADYKSNWLGPADADYTPAAMRSAILAHRYELQYCLYLFALHRLLRTRLPDYDYDRHVGGAVYLFLRGHGAGSRGLHLERPPRALIEAMDRLFAGACQETPA